MEATTAARASETCRWVSAEGSVGWIAGWRAGEAIAVAAAEVVTTDGAEGGEAAWVCENQRGEDDDDGPAVALELGGLRGPVDEAVDMFALKRAALVSRDWILVSLRPRHLLLFSASTFIGVAQHSDSDVLMWRRHSISYTLVYWANGFGVRCERRGEAKDRLEAWTSNHTHFFVRYRSNPKSV